MVKHEEAYLKLEKNFACFSDLVGITRVNNQTDKEKFAKIPHEGKSCKGVYLPWHNEMQKITPNHLVRESVLEMLEIADEFIKRFNKYYQLVVVEGWRSLDSQEQIFNSLCDKLKSDGFCGDENQIIEAASKMAWHPQVAGHPTGGAVDALIIDSCSQRILDFGTTIYDFSEGKKLYTFSPEIVGSSDIFKNRSLLHDAMTSSGFASYDGEWWHFSYGDKEYAFLTGATETLYSQVKIHEIEERSIS